MPIAQTAKQAAINTAKQVAKQTLNESNEFLKTAREQIAFTSPQQSEGGQPKPKEEPQVPPQKNLSFLNEYKGELEQIRRDNLFKELQRKIAEGEEIPLEDYVKELSYEQREVLKAQMEAVKMQKASQVAQKQDSIPQIVSKRAKGMLGAFKKRNQQHVETQKMPSN